MSTERKAGGLSRAALAVVLAASCSVVGAESGRTASGRPATSACRSSAEVGVLPLWARDGFSNPTQRLHYAVGRSRRIVAVLFGYPLVSPPTANRRNKILWVDRMHGSSSGNLLISAQRMSGPIPTGGL